MQAVSVPFGFGSGADGPGGDGDPAPFFRELEKLMSWQGGPVNWDLAAQLARRAVGADDPSVTAEAAAAVADSVRLADVWLDAATPLPSGVVRTEAWTRRRWLEATLPQWRMLCDPVAARVSEAMTATLSSGMSALGEGSAELPAELAGALPPGMDVSSLFAAGGPMLGMVRSVGGMMFGAQVGQAVGALATGISASTEVGLPLGPAGTAALLPAGVASFGAGLELPEDEVRLFLALREAAHHRLFGHVPWLRAHLTALVADYAAGIAIDPDAIAAAVQGINPADPSSMQDAMGSGVFGGQTTPAQEAALGRLETALALVEGWVDTVVAAAAADRLPSAGALREAVRRRRATGGPTEQTFATLVGLELRPRRLREAAALWVALTEARGAEGRDAVWASPDLLPSGGDLDDPAAFVGGAGGEGGVSGAGDSGDLADPIAAIEALGDAPAPREDPPGDEPPVA